MMRGGGKSKKPSLHQQNFLFVLGFFFVLTKGILGQSWALDDLPEDVRSLASFSDNVTVDCSANVSMFESVVIVEYVPDDVDSDGLSHNNRLKQELEDIFVETYNNLTREYCDPYARQLTSAKIVRVAENNTFGHIPVDIELVGTCNNCDGLDLNVYDIPSSTAVIPNGTSNDTGIIFFEDSLGRRLFESESQLSRVLQGDNSSCYCPAHPVGTRGVYETEFLDVYRKAVNESTQSTIGDSNKQLVDDTNQGLGVQVAECQFGTEFSTAFPFGLEGITNPEDLTEEEKQLIVDSLTQAIGELYAVNDEVCNPEFRIVQIAELGLAGSSRRRKVQKVTQAPVPGASTSLPSQAPSLSPVRVSSAPASPQPASSATLDLVIYVSGVCNKCGNQITLEDQTVDSRRLQDVEEWLRRLLSQATSNCFCPIGSEITAPPTLNDLLTLFEENLRSAGITYTVVNFREVSLDDCPVPVTNGCGLPDVAPISSTAPAQSPTKLPTENPPHTNHPPDTPRPPDHPRPPDNPRPPPPTPRAPTPKPTTSAPVTPKPTTKAPSVPQPPSAPKPPSSPSVPTVANVGRRRHRHRRHRYRFL